MRFVAEARASFRGHPRVSSAGCRLRLSAGSGHSLRRHNSARSSVRRALLRAIAAELRTGPSTDGELRAALDRSRGRYARPRIRPFVFRFRPRAARRHEEADPRRPSARRRSAGGPSWPGRTSHPPRRCRRRVGVPTPAVPGPSADPQLVHRTVLPELLDQYESSLRPARSHTSSSGARPHL